MVFFYETVTNSQQTNFEEKLENFEINFNEKLKNAHIILDEYQRKNTVIEYKTEFESNIQQHNECSQQLEKLCRQMRTPEVEMEERFYKEKEMNIWDTINQRSRVILETFQVVIASLDDALNILNDNILGKWKRDQILSVYSEGYYKQKSPQMQRDIHQLQAQLNEIQKYFEKLFKYVEFTLGLLSIFRDSYRRQIFVDPLEAHVNHNMKLLLQKLILSSFVVVEQPRQVINFNVK